jgi:hypothetical protein
MFIRSWFRFVPLSAPVQNKFNIFFSDAASLFDVAPGIVRQLGLHVVIRVDVLHFD